MAEFFTRVCLGRICFYIGGTSLTRVYCLVSISCAWNDGNTW